MAPCLEIFRAAATDLYCDEGAKSIQTVIDILNKTEGHIAYVHRSSIMNHVVVLTGFTVLTAAPKYKILAIGGL